MFDESPVKLLKTQYLSSGKFLSDGEWIHPKRIIDSFEIIYVVAGLVYIQEEDNKYALSKGEILILQPGKMHFGYEKSLENTSFYWLHFIDPDCYVLQNINLYSSFQDTYDINLHLKEMLHVANTLEYPEYTNNLLLWLILTEIYVRQKEHAKKYIPLLNEVCEWIRINSEKKITVKDVAERFGYNEDYITRIFKKNFDMGIKGYINEMKLKAIKNRLISTYDPIKKVSHESGFDNYKDFLKYFKYHENISPMEFRKMYFNTHLNKK